MNLAEFERRKKSLVLSADPKRKAGGRAYLDVERELQSSSEARLSEEVFLSKISKRCFDRELAKKAPDPQKLMFFKEMMVKPLSDHETQKILRHAGVRSPSEAWRHLRTHPDFNRIDIDAVRRVLGGTPID